MNTFSDFEPDTFGNVYFAHIRKFNLHLVMYIFLAFVLYSCGDSGTGANGGYGNGNGGGGGNGGTEIGTEPTFSNISQLFLSHCASCHTSQSTNGVQLNSYTNVMNSVGSQYGTNVVQPGDADASPLVDKIEPNPQFGVRMPEGGAPLSDARIQQIKTWINNGAENN